MYRNLDKLHLHKWKNAKKYAQKLTVKIENCAAVNRSKTKKQQEGVSVTSANESGWFSLFPFKNLIGM
jgi:hypothetical protein